MRCAEKGPYLVVVSQRGMAFAHARPDDVVVLPPEGHGAAKGPPVFRDHVSGPLEHLIDRSIDPPIPPRENAW